MNDQCIKPYMNARRTSTTQSSIDGRTLCTPSDLRKQQNGEPQETWFAKFRFGSPYRIRTGDLRLERAAS